MKITLLAALFALINLSGCEKTTVNPPATVIAPANTVAVPGPAGAPGAPGEKGQTGQTGEAGKTGDTVIVLPEKQQ